MSKIKVVSKVLQIKNQKKEEIEMEVKSLRNMINLAERRLESFEKTFAETTEIFHKKQAMGEMNVSELSLFHNYFIKLNGDINAQKMEMTNRLEELGIMQDELIEAHTEKKLFEILKGKIVLENTREKEATEQKEMDFMFLTKR